MKDSVQILSRCARQLFKANSAQAYLAYLVTDNSASFTCDPNTHIEHLNETLPLAFIEEIATIKRVIAKIEFTIREDIFISAKNDNPFGIILTGHYVKTLRIVPICDAFSVYGLVVLVNVDEFKYSTKQTDIAPFVDAAADLFSIKQARGLYLTQHDAFSQSFKQTHIDRLLNKIYHPVIFFNETLEITKFNKHSMNLVHQSNMLENTTIRDLLSYFAPRVVGDIVKAVENYTRKHRLTKSDWVDIPFRLNSFQTIQVDVRLVALTSKKQIKKGQANKELQFALMINDNKRNELHSLQRFQALTSLIPLGILQISKDYQCIYANDTWLKITSLTLTTSLGDGWASCFDPRDLHRILPEMERLNLQNREYCEELRMETVGKGTRWLSLKSVGLFDELGQLDGYIVTVDDVTNDHAHKQALVNLANTDSLTGISNRSSFHDRLQVAISRVDRHGNAAILFIDLDKFKVINDTYGHNTGDVVIQKVARRLHKMVRVEDTIARLGGDEFAIIFSDVKCDSDVVNLAIKIIVEVAKPMRIENNILKVQCSIGIAPIKNSRTTIKTVLKHADLAVYKAKGLGRNQFCVYTESLERETLLANYLRESLQSNIVEGFFLEYQPQVNASTNQIVGVEALSRWRHPEKLDVRPEEFILQLETHGLINDFFVWQMQAMLPLAKRWISNQLISSTCRLSVNLSAVQLHLTNFAKQLLNSFEQQGVSPNCFGLEVTETAFMQDPISAGENLQILREGGFHIILDDFGTGFSSLSLLRKMPLDSIKIDKEFIAEILTNATDAKIVQSMISLSNELDLGVVAEGVESLAVKQWLDTNSCPLQQGFHFFRPMAAQQLELCLQEKQQLH